MRDPIGEPAEIIFIFEGTVGRRVSELRRYPEFGTSWPFKGHERPIRKAQNHQRLKSNHPLQTGVP